MGQPPPRAVRRAKALPFQRAQGEMRCMLTAHDYRHTANGDPTRASVVSGHTPKQGRRHDPYATAAGGFQGLQALSPHRWPPLGAFIKLPALRVVHDFTLSATAQGTFRTTSVIEDRPRHGRHRPFAGRRALRARRSFLSVHAGTAEPPEAVAYLLELWQKTIRMCSHKKTTCHFLPSCSPVFSPPVACRVCS